MVYTDGACADQSDPDIRIAGYGVFYFPRASWNTSRPLHTHTQTSDRAELRALVWAIQWADEPTHVKLDNEYVVKTATVLSKAWEDGSNPILPSIHADLWKTSDSRFYG